MPGKSGGMDRLTDKQEKFVLELIAGKSQREAYRAAYPNCKAKDKTVDEYASRLYANPKVLARFDELQRKVRSEAEKQKVASKIEVLEELSAIGLGGKVYPVHDMFGNAFQRKPTVNERIKALDLLGKYHNLFSESLKVEGLTSVQILDNIPDTGRDEDG